MLFSGRLRSYQEQPSIYGKSGKKIDCHEFLSVSDVQVHANKTDADFKLIAGPHVNCSRSEGTMFGPASLIYDKTMLYPCNHHRCKIKCPCKICRCKETFCHNADHVKVCGGACSDCLRDLDDHSIFHRALHGSCKFCLRVHEMIPMMKFVTRSTARYGPCFTDVFRPAWLFKHLGITQMYPDKDNFDKYPCNKCEASFTSKFKLKRHEQSLHFDIRVPCPLCDMQFSREDNMKLHMRNKHKINENKNGSTNECNDCKSKFSRKNDLERHLRLAKQHCNVCSEIFCTMRQIQMHKLKQHSKFHCVHCLKSFPDKANLNKHNQRSTGPDASLKNSCQICEKTFCSETDYNKHLKSHPKTVFQCSVCKKKFSSKWRHEVHLLKRTDNNCEDCGLKLCSGYDLKVHRNAVHVS